METEINQPSESQPFCFVIVVGYPRNPMNGQYLKSPTDARSVKRYGYGLTKDLEKAWTFPSEAQAKAKAVIVDRHMAWGDGVLMVEAKPQHDCSASCSDCGQEWYDGVERECIKRGNCGFVPRFVRLGDVISIVSKHPEYPEPCPMLHEVSAKAAAEMNKEWVMHIVRETCRQTKEAILADLKQSLPNVQGMARRDKRSPQQ